jgi:tetratricopeptide (TPR) repeat protein
MLLSGLLAVSAPNGFGQQVDPVVQLYGEAKTAEASGDYPQATQKYERIIQLRPDLAEAHANLGNLYYVQSKYDSAQKSFERALKLKPQLAGPHFFLGVLAFRNRDWVASKTRLSKAAEFDPRNPAIQLQLGYTYYASGDYVQAISHLETAVQTDQRNDDAWYHLGKLYSQMSRLHFDELQLSHPGSHYTHLARAHFFEGQSNWVEAAAEYKLAQEAKPELGVGPKLQYLEARAAGRQAEWAGVSEEVDGATPFLHQPPPTSEVLAQLWQRRSQMSAPGKEPQHLYKLAEEYQLLSYLAALWVYGSNTESHRAHQLKGESLEAAGRNDEAIAEYRQALQKKPDLQSVHFAIGNILWRATEFDQALKELQAELEVSPNDPQAHYEIADILLTQGQLDQAAVHYEKCLRHAPETVEAHLALDRIYTTKGDPLKALVHLKKAAEVAPNDPAPHYRLWLLYRKQGKTAEAQAALKKFDALKKSSKPSQGMAAPQ